MESTKVTENPVVQAAADVILTRPDLTEEEWLVVEKAAPYYKALLKPELLSELEIDYSKKYEEFVDRSRKEMQDAVTAKFEEWKKAQEPINTEELTKLISQEYKDFKIPIPTEEGGVKLFVIKELPKAVESRFVKLLQKTLVPMLENRELLEFKWEALPSMSSKINALLGLIPNALDVMCDMCAVCLDPYEKNSEINGEWVSTHLSTARIQAIVLLQIEVNKLRDFFLSSFRLFQNLSNRKMM